MESVPSGSESSIMMVLSSPDREPVGPSTIASFAFLGGQRREMKKQTSLLFVTLLVENPSINLFLCWKNKNYIYRSDVLFKCLCCHFLLRHVELFLDLLNTQMQVSVWVKWGTGTLHALFFRGVFCRIPKLCR